MQVFHVRYRNTQGTLMRILNAVSRRGLEMPYLTAHADGDSHKAVLLLEVNQKQIGQLCRDWYAIVDVTDVHTAAAEAAHSWVSGLQPSSSDDSAARAARA